MNRNRCKFLSLIRSVVLTLAVVAPWWAPHAEGAKASKEAPVYIFFPPPPDEARIQFLTSFCNDEQFSELEGKRSFFRFVVGQEKSVRGISKPYGVGSGPGKIFICDTGSATVQVADLARKKMEFWRPTGDGTLGMPINIVVDADGTRYITDTKRGQVLIYKEESYVGGIGKLNEMKPTGVALTKNRIYVSDLQNLCVRVYDKASRKELFVFPKVPTAQAAANGTNGTNASGTSAGKAQASQPGQPVKTGTAAPPPNGKLFGPTNLAIDPQGRVYVSDSRGFVVNVYDSEGKYLQTIGQMGLSPGCFSLPKGIAVDRESRSYVVDANTQLVQLFDKEGRILMYFGDPSTTGGGSMCLPAGVAIDYENVKYFQRFASPDFLVEYLVWVTNQAGGRKVSVFGFGHKK